MNNIDLPGLKTVGWCYDIFPTFRRLLCAASLGVVLPALFSGRRKGVGLQRRLLSSTSSPLGYCCWGSLLVAGTSVLQLGKGSGLQIRRCRPRSPSSFSQPPGDRCSFVRCLLELSSLNEPWSVNSLPNNQLKKIAERGVCRRCCFFFRL